jgi:hypothetical protein
MLACIGSACFIAQLSSSVEDVDGRKDVDLPGPETLDGYARSADAAQF